MNIQMKEYLSSELHSFLTGIFFDEVQALIAKYGIGDLNFIMKSKHTNEPLCSKLR